MAGLSQRAYASHRGVSHTAVEKAIAAGRISTLADGGIDPTTADAEWERNTFYPHGGASSFPHRLPTARHGPRVSHLAAVLPAVQLHLQGEQP